MKRQGTLLIILAAVVAISWLAFRPANVDGEKKGILKERIRAAESTMHTLDAERASGRERLSLARKTADENRARSTRAAAALPFFEQRRKEAEINLAEREKNQNSFENVSGCRVKPGMTTKGRADGTEQTAADNAALLRRLNALLQ